MGHPSTSWNCGFQLGPSLPMREAVVLTTLHYAAAHERLFSDKKKNRKKEKNRTEKERQKQVICIPFPLLILCDRKKKEKAA